LEYTAELMRLKILSDLGDRGKSGNQMAKPESREPSK
jgi:hypothetical protein